MSIQPMNPTSRSTNRTTTPTACVRGKCRVWHAYAAGVRGRYAHAAGNASAWRVVRRANTTAAMLPAKYHTCARWQTNHAHMAVQVRTATGGGRARGSTQAACKRGRHGVRANVHHNQSIAAVRNSRYAATNTTLIRHRTTTRTVRKNHQRPPP